jgi:hypothetical protein
LLLAWERRGELRSNKTLGNVWAQLRRPLALVVGAPLTLLATPYGLEIVAYYRATLGNSQLQHAVTEWQPITSHWAMALPFFLLVGMTIWSFGRRSDKTTTWEKASLLILALLSVDVLRNDLLFGMAALMIVPASVDAAVPVWRKRSVPVRDRLNAALAWGAIVIALFVVAATALRPAGAFGQQTQRAGVLQTVRQVTAADPSLKVMADVRYSDWLLWRDRQLAGRMGSDCRFELLSNQALSSMNRLFSALGTDWKAGARGYRLVVLNRSASPDAVKGFLQEPGRRVLYKDKQNIVILRTASAAARA